MYYVYYSFKKKEYYITNYKCLDTYVNEFVDLEEAKKYLDEAKVTHTERMMNG